MARRDPITLHAAAERLGVHYMTAYRYVRTGRLPATRDGGQWRVDPSDVERFRRASSSPRPRGSRGRAPERLEQRLLAGDVAGAWSVKPVALRRMESGLGVPVEMDEPAASGTEAAPEHPLANALFSFAFDRPAERDALLARVLPRLVWHGRDLFIGEPDRYYVNSLGYLPFLARAGRFTAP